MKSITVKHNGLIAHYTGKNYQDCYNHLIDHLKRIEFEKNLISILSNYKERMMEDWINIKIDISYSNKLRSHGLNISNPNYEIETQADNINDQKR